MDPTDGMNTFAGRLATFEVEHHVSKRRASSTGKKPTSTVSWPHESPTPEQLAKAGFYYKPSSNSPDSVTCFLCNKALDGWDADDNPALEHLSHVPDCGWAINVCIEQRSQDPQADEEDPLSEKMTDARLATFKDWWPHDGKRGWKCTVKKMVNAGWSYTPVPNADDCVTCFYCGVSLDGWEPKDDPLEEHRRRAPECQFFVLKEKSVDNKPATKPKKGRVSRTSRVSRLSTQSNMSLVSEAPSLTQMDDTEAEDGDTLMTATSTVPKAGKGRKKVTKAKATQKSGRKATRQQDVSVVEATGGEDTNLTTEPEAVAPTEPSPESKPTKTRGGKRNTKQEPVSETAHPVDELAEGSPPRKTKRAKASKKKPPRSSGIDQGDSHMESSVFNDESNARSRRGVKRTSDGYEKVEIPVLPDEKQPVLQTEEPKPKTRGRPKKQDIQHSEPSIELGEVTEPKPKTKGKGKNASVKAEDTVYAEETSKKQTSKSKKGRPAASRTIEESEVQLQDDNDELQLVPAASKSSRLTRTRASHEMPPDQSENEIQGAPPKHMKGSTPLSSPQSSDAENHLPSSRVSLASRPSLNAFPEPPSAVKAAPANVATGQFAITTPPVSPSKRHIITSGIASSMPWTAIDLATAYPLSPKADDPDTAAAELKDLLQKAKPGLLTSPEKQMTVEEWILWNAARAEEQMRAECERMIQRFEEEGGRAMRVLEGVECV